MLAAMPIRSCSIQYAKMVTTRHIDRWNHIDRVEAGAFLYAPFLIRYLFIAS